MLACEIKTLQTVSADLMMTMRMARGLDQRAIFMHQLAYCKKWLKKRMGFMKIPYPWHSGFRKIATSSSDGCMKLFYEKSSSQQLGDPEDCDETLYADQCSPTSTRVNKHWKDAVYSICLACLKEEPPGGADCLIFVNETHVDQLLCWHSDKSIGALRS